MAKNSLRIDVLGSSFAIVAEEDPLYLEGLLNRYKIKLAQIQKQTGIDDPLKMAILAGFQLCDDLEKTASGDRGGAIAMSLSERIEGLTSRIGEAIDEIENEIPAAVSEKSGGQAELSVNRIHKLKNTIQFYDWGAPALIPNFLAQPPDGRPFAELWMGTHKGGESKIVLRNGEVVPLSKLAGELGFLFKVLGVGKPLSIQVHPNVEEAEAGFERENNEGIPLKSPVRNFKDGNAKDEVVLALSRFTALAGFRAIDEIIHLFQKFEAKTLPVLRNIFSSLKSNEIAEGEKLKVLLSSLVNISEDDKSDLAVHLSMNAEKFAEDNDMALRLTARLSYYFPGDAFCIAPLFLNVVELNEYEAIYIPPGVPHCYLEGLALELMRASDNVIRGGLTAKHIDKDLLQTIIKYNSFDVKKITGVKINDSYTTYSLENQNLNLLFWQNDNAFLPGAFLPGTDMIVIATEGVLKITDKACGDDEIILKQGESAFIPGRVNRDGLEFSGACKIVAAGSM
jgi:mannose-6-phosphate isomerase